MKKFNILFFLFLISGKLFSQQPFAPPGAVWQYDHWGPWGVGFLKIEYASDTIIQNIFCKRLSVTDYRWFGQTLSINYSGSKFVYQSADTVYWFTGNQFRVLYNFNAQQGDLWVVSDSAMSSDCDTSRVMVQNTGTDTINGNILRYLDVVKAPYSALEFYGRIYERLGSVGFLFPEYADCDSGIVVDDAVYHLHCYHDSSFQIYNLDTNDCDFWFDVSTKDLYNSTVKIVLYPTPATDYLEVISDKPLKSYCIYNQIGRIILHNSNAQNKINLRLIITDLLPGFYILEAETTAGKQFMKFVKR